MALQKNILETNGVTTTYHRIENVFLGHDRTLSCVLASYVTADFANASRNKINSNHFSFENVSVEEEESMGVRKLAYTKIKELEQWADATDC